MADDGSAVSKSMAYTVSAPSKRVRPVLTLLAAEICGGTSARALSAAAVMELVHASSLILDDLPSMDDAPLRRGRKANHLEFGEAVAILAAFGLLNLAYRTLVRAYEPAVSARLTGMPSASTGSSAGRRSTCWRRISRSTSRRSSAFIEARPERCSVRRPPLARWYREPRLMRSDRWPRTPRTWGSRFRSSTTSSTSR